MVNNERVGNYPHSRYLAFPVDDDAAADDLGDYQRVVFRNGRVQREHMKLRRYE